MKVNKNQITKYALSFFIGILTTISSQVIYKNYLSPKPYLRIATNIQKGQNIITITIENLGKEKAKYLFLDIETGSVIIEVKTGGTLGLKTWGGERGTFLQVVTQDVLPGDFGYLRLVLYGNGNFSISVKSDAQYVLIYPPLDVSIGKEENLNRTIK